MNQATCRRAYIIGGATALAYTGIRRVAVRAAQFDFKCGSALASDHPSSLRLTQMWAAIEQESGGRIHTTFFPSGQLGSDTALFSQLRIGAVPFGYLAPGVLGAVVAPAGIAFVGFAFKDVDEALRVMDGPLGEYVGREAQAKGLYVMRSMWNNGMTQIGTIPHPIHVPDDLHDLKIRVSESKIMFDMFKTLGSNPVTLNLSEEYTALQTRTVDGEVGPLAAILTSKFYEVNKYVCIANHTWAGQFLVANGDAWKSLPPDLQAIVERNNAKYSRLELADTKRSEVTIANQLKAFGLLINTVDQAPFRARLQSYYQALASSFGAIEWGLLENALGRRLA